MRQLLMSLLLNLFLFVAPACANYNPLTPLSSATSTIDMAVRDSVRNRDIPLHLYLPASSSPAPIILFSHGLGGAKTNNVFLGQHWAQRGYIAVFMQHIGSDESLWKDKGLLQGAISLKKGMSAKTYLDRMADVPAVINQLTTWNKDAGNKLYNRLDLSRLGMSGHSYGALTTQALSGQSDKNGKQRFTDPRIKAAIMLSPSSGDGNNPNTAFGQVQVPWLLMTGTQDASPRANITMENRLAVYPALPAGNKYQIVFDGAKHSDFGDSKPPTDKRYHPAIMALSTAFWDAYLKGDAEAKAWLQGSGALNVLSSKDQWDKK